MGFKNEIKKRDATCIVYKQVIGTYIYLYIMLGLFQKQILNIVTQFVYSNKMRSGKRINTKLLGYNMEKQMVDI